MAQFRLRRSRLRGSTNSRLRGGIAVADGTVRSGSAVAGLTPGTATSPRFGHAVGGPGISARVTVDVTGQTPVVRPAILKRDIVSVSPGIAPKPRAAVGSPTRPRATITVTKRPQATSPATQKHDDVTGVTPHTGTSEATGGPSVPDGVTATPSVPKPRVVPKRK